MKDVSNVETGRSLDRIVAFSDAIFAFAMTLLAIGITLPDLPKNITANDLSQVLIGLFPNIVGYFICFFSVGLHWIAHHRYFRYIKRSDSGLIWINLALMLFIAFTPFPSSLLIRYGNLPVAWMAFALTMGVVGILSSTLWSYASRNHRLIDPHLGPSLVKLVQFRAFIPSVVFFSSIFIAVASPTTAELSTLTIPLLLNLVNRRYQ